jgi:hypothetical protein
VTRVRGAPLASARGMTSWTRRIPRWTLHSNPWKRARAPRPARRDGEILVLQADGHAFRAAHVERRGRQLASLGATHGELARCLEFLRGHAGAPVVVVTHEVEPRVVQLPDGTAAVDPQLFAHAGPSARGRWTRLLEAEGLELRALYPLAGSVVGALAGDENALCVQVEHGLVAVMALARGRCMELELVQGAAPTARRVQELIGEACPEVVLCGGGADLSELGYALACGGSTWVRILRPRVPEPAGTELAALYGAARHALGLVPAGRLSAVPVPAGGER